MENQINSGMYNHQANIMITPAESTWTRHEDKLFETALVHVPENIPGRWHEIAKAVTGKTAEQVKARYQELLDDLDKIESGQVELPNYTDGDDGKKSFVSFHSLLKRSEISFAAAKVSKHGEGGRKKGTPWTQEEHRNFLLGLEQFGKGDWRSISRISVVTRTPTQVASHAQKYFIRQETKKQLKKRNSIHDITITGTKMVVEPPPATNIYNGQGGGGGGGEGEGGAPPPQMGFEYQKEFGYRS